MGVVGIVGSSSHASYVSIKQKENFNIKHVDQIPMLRAGEKSAGVSLLPSERQNAVGHICTVFFFP